MKICFHHTCSYSPQEGFSIRSLFVGLSTEPEQHRLTLQVQVYWNFEATSPNSEQIASLVGVSSSEI